MDITRDGDYAYDLCYAKLLFRSVDKQELHQMLL
jgi:hypothetical protein